MHTVCHSTQSVYVIQTKIVVFGHALIPLDMTKQENQLEKCTIEKQYDYGP